MWAACVIPGVRCAQCRRYIPSHDAVEELLKDMTVLCDECDWMQARNRLNR